MQMRSIVISLVTGCAVACSSGNSTGGNQTGAPSLSVASGDQQTALVNTALSLPLVVSIDAANRTASYGKTVTWTVVTGGGHLSA